MTDLALVLQTCKRIAMKMELLNDGYQVVDELQGSLLTLALTISANSNVRRVGSASLVVQDNAQFATSGQNVWLDRMVRVYIGIWDSERKDYQWFLQGSFLFSRSSYTMNLDTKQISLNLTDMMGATTEERGAQIGTGVLIPEGSKIEDVLASTIARFSPYKRYNVCAFEGTVPYDLEFESGTYPYPILDALLKLYPCYEQFYTKEGVYTVQKIPSAISDPVVLSHKDMAQLVISEDGDIDYAEVRNATEIWGQELDAVYTAKSCTTVADEYQIYINVDFKVLEDGATYSFTPLSASVASQRIKIQDTASALIYKETGAGVQSVLPAGAMKANVPYVFKYAGGKFILQGESLIHAMCMEYNTARTAAETEALKAFYDCDNISFVINPESSFACDRINVINQVLQGGEFDNIYTTELALERASYENWKTTRLKEEISVECLFVPWLDVNQKIEYKSIATGEIHEYLIREINIDVSAFTMTLHLIRFYPFYPWLT